MNIIDCIKNRRSVRTFDEVPLSSEEASKLLAFASDADNPYGLKIHWRLLSAKESDLSTTVIVGADDFIAGKMKKAPHAEEAFGYSFERIVLFAESIGIKTTWIAGTMDRPAFEKAVELGEDEVMPCVSPLGHEAKRMSVREAVMRKAIKADSRFDFSDLFFDGSFDNPFLKGANAALDEVLEAVRLSPSAVNKQPWRAVISGSSVHFYEKRSKGYVNKETSWDLQKVDMGIALSHFALAAEEKGIPCTFFIDDPGLDAPEETYYIASFNIA